MARARNIKPALFDNDELAENDPLGRLLFIGMWTIADFKGDFVWREKRIKAKLLPYDNCDIKKLAINLDKSGFIRFYSDGDEVYCNVTTFNDHQNPHKNERLKGSDIPAYSEEMRQAVDLKGLTINRDKSGLESEYSHSDRADSLIPYPDSLILNPESCTPESNADKSADIDLIPFDDFWNIWPKKTGGDPAKKSWKKLKVDNSLFNLIKHHLITLDAYGQTEKQFIPNPATYLNQKRWEDEVIPASTGRSGIPTATNSKEMDDWLNEPIDGEVISNQQGFIEHG